jgi:hypothetical protein
MKYSFTTLCFLSLLLLAIGAAAQNAAYSSYYSYTVSYNLDGISSVTPVAEVSGIDDVSDWIEGQYRPVCSVKPKTQLTGDADWVLGQGYGLGHVIDQVRTGQALQVPSSGSNFRLQYSVEVDVRCTGAPNQAYFQYPSLAYLSGWSYIDLNFWYLLGFSPFQASPPSHTAYCPSAVVCPVGYGVASILNFVDFADFADMGRLPFRGAPYRQVYSHVRIGCAANTAGWDRQVAGQVVDQFGVPFTTDGILMTEKVFISTSHNDLGLNNLTIGSVSTFYDVGFQTHGAYGDTFNFCSYFCPSSGETDAIQTLTWNGLPVLHSNWLAYRCGGTTVDGY